MAGVEPTLSAYANPLARYFAATRPAFLSVTLVGVLLGLASAHAGGVKLDPLTAFVTLFFALVAPENSAGVHLKALSKVSRLFRSDTLRDAILAANTREEIYALIAQEDARA